MVDRVDLAPPPADPVVGAEAPQGNDRPAWLPAEFTSVEDFTKSYADTKAELTRKSQELASLRKEPDPPAEGDPPPAKPDAPKTPEGAALEIKDEVQDKPADGPTMEDFAPYQQEFVQTGDVAPENREKIADKLKPLFGDMALAVVNDYIEGSKVRRDATTSELMSAAGGAEQYGAMMGWAKDNLSQPEKEAYNRQVNSGDVHSAKFAIEALRAKYEKVAGREPKLVAGDGTITPAPNGAFKSVQEMTAAMKDPRYAKDPAYRATVLERVKLSNL